MRRLSCSLYSCPTVRNMPLRVLAPNDVSLAAAAPMPTISAATGKPHSARATLPETDRHLQCGWITLHLLSPYSAYVIFWDYIIQLNYLLLLI